MAHPPKHSEAVKQEARKMVSSGMSMSLTARTLKIPYASIWTWTKGLGVIQTTRPRIPVPRLAGIHAAGVFWPQLVGWNKLP